MSSDLYTIHILSSSPYLGIQHAHLQLSRHSRRVNKAIINIALESCELKQPISHDGANYGGREEACGKYPLPALLEFHSTFSSTY